MNDCEYSRGPIEFPEIVPGSNDILDFLEQIRKDGHYQVSSNPNTMFEMLDERAPVLGNFTVLEPTANGFPPESIREEWVGVTLPVRCIDSVAIGYPVWVVDALIALRKAGKIDGFQWWEQKYRDQGTYSHGPDGAQYVGEEDFLVFNENHGHFELVRTTS